MEEEGNNKHGGETLSWDLEMAILQWINLIWVNKADKVAICFENIWFCSFGEKSKSAFSSYH